MQFIFHIFTGARTSLSLFKGSASWLVLHKSINAVLLANCCNIKITPNANMSLQKTDFDDVVFPYPKINFNMVMSIRLYDM